MRIEAAWLNHLRIVVEVGDWVALADAYTHEVHTEKVQVREVPCRIEWNVERRGYVGWALFDERGQLVTIGDAHSVRPGDIYSLDVPAEGR